MNKEDLLHGSRREHGNVDALIAKLADDAALEQLLEGGPSLKDVLAHIAGWLHVGQIVLRLTPEISG